MCATKQSNQQPETNDLKQGTVIGEYYYLKAGDPFRKNDESQRHGEYDWFNRKDEGLATVGVSYDPGRHWPTRRSVYEMTDPGEGYRLLKKGEPFEVGDEWYDYKTDSWSEEFSGISQRQTVGGGWGWIFTYRRKVKAEPVVEAKAVNEYRSLERNVDFIEEGDEFMEGLATWKPVPHELVGHWYTSGYMPMRRVVEKPVVETKTKYIFLTVGDTVQQGDEYITLRFCRSRWDWDKSGRIGITLTAEHLKNYIYRRRVD